MTVQYAPNKLRVPSGFNNLLEGLAREVLREQPVNIIQFASDYFKTQLQLRDETVGNGDTGPPEVKDEAPAAEVAAKEEEVKPAEDTPKVEETAKTEETAKAEETPTSGEESKTEEPPKADSPEQQEVAPKLSEEEAATKIQAIVRGKKARDDVKAMKEGGESEPAETNAAAENATPAPEGEKTDEAAPQEDDEASPEEQEKAAVKIQASFRGIQARKKVDAMKENKDESTKDTPAEAEAEAPSGGDAPTES